MTLFCMGSLCASDVVYGIINRYFLQKERDEARALLAQAERQIPASVAGAAPAAVVSNGKRGTSCLMFSI